MVICTPDKDLAQCVRGTRVVQMDRRTRDRAFLFRDLATLRSHLSLFDSIDDLHWDGPTPAFAPLAARLDAASSSERV